MKKRRAKSWCGPDYGRPLNTLVPVARARFVCAETHTSRPGPPRVARPSPRPARSPSPNKRVALTSLRRPSLGLRRFQGPGRDSALGRCRPRGPGPGEGVALAGAEVLHLNQGSGRPAAVAVDRRACWSPNPPGRSRPEVRAKARWTPRETVEGLGRGARAPSARAATSFHCWGGG